MNLLEFSRRVRLPLGFVLGITYLIFADPRPAMLLPGLGLGAAGLAIRGWAAGHINKNNRLAVYGPYSYVRNPLYLGSFLLAAGFALIWSNWFVVAVVAFFAVVYAPTVRAEEQTVQKLFPDQFPDFRANVPPFLPRASPWRPDPDRYGPRTSFSPYWYWRHKEWQALLGYAAAVALLLLRLRFGA